ncbi:hypothetical protein [Ornithinimicrobium murale]|uniref:hypothetical protein n=1 Tax=Ornithinimicrobium murale TaxID=1050153 RepID=UPI000E0DF01F|nr:hypothetical protein [Ornithinimicrobium murale]
MLNDSDTDDLLTIIFLVAAAVVGGPSVLGAFGVDVGSFLLRYGILVPGSEAVFVLPLVGAGLDERRVALLGIVVALGLLAGFARLFRGSRD